MINLECTIDKNPRNSKIAPQTQALEIHITNSCPSNTYICNSQALEPHQISTQLFNFQVFDSELACQMSLNKI